VMMFGGGLAASDRRYRSRLTRDAMLRPAVLGGRAR